MQSTGCRPTGCMVETARVRSEENQRCTLTDLLREIMETNRRNVGTREPLHVLEQRMI